MKNAFAKISALFLSVVMIVTLIPSYAYAEDLLAPANLVVVNDEYGYVYLKWNESEDAYRYNIYQSSDGVNFTKVSSTCSNEYYCDTDASKGLYYYYVTAYQEYYIYDYDEDTGDESEYKTTYESNPSNVVSVPIYNSNLNINYSYEDYYDDDSSINSISWSVWLYKNPEEEFDGFYVYESDNGGEFNLVATIPVTAYTSVSNSRYCYQYNIDKLEAGSYKFVVSTYANLGGVVYTSPDFTDYYECNIYMPAPVLTTKTKSQIIKWKKVSGAQSYEIWQSKSYKSYKKIATVSANTNSYTVKNVNNYKADYSYYVVCIKNGVAVSRTESADSDDSYARMRAANKKTKNKNSVTVVNTRESKTTTAWTVTLSKKDKQILANFAKKHFKKGMTKAEKAEYTLKWINQNVKYAYGNSYKKVEGCSYVEAIFSKKLGQCLQYNGAYAMFLTYLGYDARIVQGWRGYSMSNKWSHYWCEIKIDGKWYLMETGNNQDSGSWMYFCQPYRNTSGYLINKKQAK